MVHRTSAEFCSTGSTIRIRSVGRDRADWRIGLPRISAGVVDRDADVGVLSSKELGTLLCGLASISSRSGAIWAPSPRISRLEKPKTLSDISREVALESKPWPRTRSKSDWGTEFSDGSR